MTQQHGVPHLCVSCSVSACWLFGQTCGYTPYTRTLWFPCEASCGAAERVWSSCLHKKTSTQYGNDPDIYHCVMIYTERNEVMRCVLQRWGPDLSHTLHTGSPGCHRGPWGAPSTCPSWRMIFHTCHSCGSSPLDDQRDTLTWDGKKMLFCVVNLCPCV